MLRILICKEAGDALKRILDDEGGDACIRLREFRNGSGWGDDLSITLGLCVDARDEDDLHVEVASLPFIMNSSLVNMHGCCFAVVLDKNNTPSIRRPLVKAK